MEAWGCQPLAPHVIRIWWALRDELVEPLEPGPGEGPSNTAVAAADALRRYLAAEARSSSATDSDDARQPSSGLLNQVRHHRIASTGQVCISP